MLSKRYESIEIDRITWLHVPSGTHWSTNSYIYQVVEIYKKTISTLEQMQVQAEAKNGWCNKPTKF